MFGSIHEKMHVDEGEHARAIAAQYQLRLVPTSEDEFIGSSIELPLLAVHGSARDIVATTRDALVQAVAVMLRNGMDPPAPANARRDIQINVRVSAAERVTLEA